MSNQPNNPDQHQPDTGLAVRRVPYELLAEPDPARTLAEVVPEDGTMPVVQMTMPHTALGDRHTHQHVHLHVEAPRQPIVYRSWSWTYYGNHSQSNSSPTALPAPESAIAIAMVRCVRLLLWGGGVAFAVYLVGKYMKWW